ncbi:MAG: helix-turn-helix domain-containing protein [Desulfobacterium sp.]|nr:helix-turn-helix domain-containing protein [Desulfobacterium sp.]
MKAISQQKLAKATGLSQGYISKIMSGVHILDSWRTAKKLASATNTDPTLWLEGTSDAIRAALKQETAAQ